MPGEMHCEACGEKAALLFGVRNDRARQLFPNIMFRDRHSNMICQKCLKEAERKVYHVPKSKG